MQTPYKYQYSKKYKINSLGIWGGFLLFFGFMENPYTDHIKNTYQRSDFDALRSDWETVGNDFHSVIEKENLKVDACK